MPRRVEPILEGRFCHVYNRGNNRAPIFLEEANYAFFIKQLRQFFAGTHAAIVAYVLMPNHYHLLLRALSGEMSQAIQRFSISYTKAINLRFDRVGALFQGAFQAKEVATDEYLLHLSRYIHLNPLRAKLVDDLPAWIYSSYHEYVGLRQGTLPNPKIVWDSLVNSGASWSIAEVQRRYKAFVDDYQPPDREKIASLLF